MHICYQWNVTDDAILYDATVGLFWIKSTTELKYVAKFHLILAFLEATYVILSMVKTQPLAG